MNDGGDCDRLALDAVDDSVAVGELFAYRLVPELRDDTPGEGEAAELARGVHDLLHHRGGINDRVLGDVRGDGLNVFESPGRLDYSISHLLSRSSASSWVTAPSRSAASRP